MKHKVQIIIIGLIGLIFISSTIVSAKNVISFINHVDTGVVDIELIEYQKNADGELVPWENGVQILPGMMISKIPRIINVGYDCYIRANVEMSNPELENSYQGIGENWIRGRDGYWYYTKILKANKWTELFQGIFVPKEFNQMYEGNEISLNVEVHAIQAQNFLPDYEAMHPWGNVKIQTCIQKAPHTIWQMETDAPKQFEVQYDEGAGGLVKNEEDLFVNIPTLFPGDVYTDVLHLSNPGDENVKLFFSSYSEQSKLLSQIHLRIAKEDGEKEQLVYEGTMSDAALKEWILLAELDAKKEQRLVFTVEIPKKLDNSYTLSEDSVRWMFSTEDRTNVVKTGDAANLYASCSGMLLSGIIFFAAAFFRRSSLKKEVSI